jgi:hypothetical protein
MALAAGFVWGQTPPAAAAPDSQVVLDWTPPAFAQLNAQATTRTSLALDRNELAVAAALAGGSDADTKQAIAKIDGVSVHLLRFGPAGITDETPVDAVREAYHQRGWKHLVTNTSVAGAKGPLPTGTTDVWLVLDGLNVRGAVVLVESRQSLSLVTLTGDLSPIDLLHLRGHFGIPKFDGDSFKDAKDK